MAGTPSNDFEKETDVNNRTRTRTAELLVLVVMAMVFGALVSSILSPMFLPSEEKREAVPVTFAVGHGYHYTIPIVMEHFKLVEKYSGGAFTLKVESMKGGVILEGLLAGTLQFAQQSAPAVLGGISDGAPTKILSSMGKMKHELWTSDPNLKSFADMTGETQIVMNNPASIEAIGVRIALERVGKRFDDIEPVYVTHPDGYQLMLSGEVNCHYAGTPYTSLYAKEPEKYHLLGTDTDIFGIEMPGSVLYATTDYVEANPSVVACVLAAWQEGISWINANQEEACRMATKFYGDPTGTAWQDWQDSELVFDSTFGLADLGELSKLLYDSGVIVSPYTAEEILFPVGLSVKRY